jgi:hypothetical protein
MDTVAAWFARPVEGASVAWLRKQCGRGGLHPEWRRARFDHRYTLRIEFRQPNEAAIRWLAERDDVLINLLHPAIDYIFRDSDECAQAKELFDRCQVRRWHGKNQQVRFDHGTRYDAYRWWSPTVLTNYVEDYSRITGECHCLHLEWRAYGCGAVRRCGIERSADLLEFDHREFWCKRLLLAELDPERLGRLLRNRASRTKSRVPLLVQYNLGRGRCRMINSDLRLGNSIVRAHETTQQVLDALRGVRLDGAVIRLDTVDLLPPPLL